MYSKKVENYREVEDRLHARFKDKRYRNEWYTLKEEHIDLIEEYVNKWSE